MKRNALILCLGFALGMAGTPTLYADQVYTIYPIPQEQIAGVGTVSLSATVNIVCDEYIDQYTKDRATEVLKEKGIAATFSDQAKSGQTNLYLAVSGSKGPADRKAEDMGIDRAVLSREGKFDRHIVSLSADGTDARIVILGENTDAVFYGLASLEQMLDGGTASLACVTINDYADQQSRGLVEGYYGYPYSVAVKKDLMKFMARYKLNTYLYGAKSDPYHSGYWQDPYPTSITAQQEKNGWLTQEMFKELTAQAHASKVNFIWAIHPGLNTKTDQNVNQVFSKFQLMYDLGVRQFAVFTDDVGVENASEFPKYTYFFTQLQNRLDETYNKDYESPADTVKPLHFVPHIYAASFANAETRKTYFNELSNLPEKIVVYTTGNGVWSVPNSNDLATIKNDLGRDVAWWWNYPCNDNGRSDSEIFISDMYRNFVEMTQVSDNARLPQQLNNAAGILSNPMQQGEISKIALFSVADYAWNNDGFNNTSSWEAALPAVLGDEYAAAFRTLAPYLCYDDPSTLSRLIQTYKTNITMGREADATALHANMDEISAACDKIAGMETSEIESDRLFFEDLRPWFYLVRDMAATTKAFLDAKDVDDMADQWDAYLAAQKSAEALTTDSRYVVETLEGMGTNPPVGQHRVNASSAALKPFVTEWLGSEAFNDLFPERDALTTPQLYTTVASAPKLNVANTTQGIYFVSTTTLAVGPDERIGFELPAPKKITSITIADSLKENFSLIASQNGKTWTTLTPDALTDVPYKYVCLHNAGSGKLWFSPTRTTFSMTTEAPTAITGATIPSGEAWQGHTKELIHDGDYTTFCTLNQNQKQGDAYQVTLRTAVPIHDVRICMGTTNGDYMQVGNVQISEDGTRWINIPISGTRTVNFTMSDENVVRYSDEMSYCDFDGEGRTARYVRLLLRTANTSKWLRLYEIEVNRKHDTYGDLPVALTGDGQPAPEVFDNRASTSYASSATGSLTYNLLNPEELDGLSFFMDGSRDYEAKVSATRDGEHWTPLGTLSGPTPYLSLSRAGMKDAVAVRLEWTGLSPIIHEICEYTTTPSTNLSDALIEGGGSQRISLSQQGGRLQLASTSGIVNIALYTPAGQQLAQLRPSGEKLVTIPAVRKSCVIIKATTADGDTASYKVSMK